MKEKLNEQQILGGSGEKVQYISPFFPNDAPVFKKTDAKGQTKYFFRSEATKGQELRVCSTDLETELMCLLEPIEIIERALGHENQLSYANTLTAIRQGIANAIHETFRFVNQNVGEIEITAIHELDIGSMYRWGQLVDAELLPPDTLKKQAIFDHDPELIDELKMISPDKTEPIRRIIREIQNTDRLR